MLRRTWLCCQKGERGLYFPINHRIVDRRVAPGVSVEEAELQSRSRRELRTNFTTGATRQTECPTWSAAVRPTHFFSLRLPPKNALTARMKEIHNTISFSHQLYVPAFVPLERLHVTLGVFSVPESNGASQPPAARSEGAEGRQGGADSTLQAIHSCLEEVSAGVKPFQLCFRGVGTFSSGRVLFARVTPEAGFGTLDNLVQRLRREVGVGLGVDMKGNPYDSYVPHATIAKIRPNQKATLGPRIPTSIWAPFQFEEFGDVRFGSIDICSMSGRSPDGYYKVISSVPLQK